MVFRRGMSVTPPLSEQLPRTNKFKGEAFGIPTNNRTIYAGSEEDTTQRESRVILLVGPQTAGKSSLIDFLCNYFYGADLESTTRYHIANEKFDSTTPEKQIITYVFNDTVMDVRPVVIDTPSTSGPHADENREVTIKWLKDNEKLKIDAVGVVFSAYHRMTSTEEEYLQKALAAFPEHLHTKRIVFITGSDGSSPPVGMLRRFNLDRADVYKVNTSCIFQRPEDDPLQEHLRGNYWRMSMANFGALFSRLKYGDSPSFFSFKYEQPPKAMSPTSMTSTSSQNSFDTVIHRTPGGEEIHETQTRTINGDTVTTTTKKVTTMKSVRTEEDVIVHPPKLVVLDHKNTEKEATGFQPLITQDQKITKLENSTKPANETFSEHQKIVSNGFSSIGLTSATENISKPSQSSILPQISRKDSEKTPSEKPSSTPRPPLAPPAPPVVPSPYRDAPGVHSSLKSSNETTVTQSDVRNIPIQKITEKKKTPGHQYDEVPREYADERTPNPSPRSTGIIGPPLSGRHSAERDHKFSKISSTYSHQDKNSTITSSGSRDPARHSDNIATYSPASGAKSLETSTQATKMPYTPLSQFEEHAPMKVTPRKSRETTIDDPYYPPYEQFKGNQSPARHSWHELRPTQLGNLPLVQSQPNKVVKETVIDFPSPSIEQFGVFQRHFVSQPSRPSYSPRSRSADRIDAVTQQQAAAGWTYGENVAGKQQTDFASHSRRYDEVPSEEYEVATRRDKQAAEARQDRLSQGAITATERSGMQTQTAKPAYAQIHKGAERTAVMASTEGTARERTDMKRQTTTDTDRTSYPDKGRPYYSGTAEGEEASRQIQAQNGTVRNEFMIPEQMRANRSPIMVRVQMAKKSSSETGATAAQQNMNAYGGDEWGEETTITRKIDHTRPRPQLIEEHYRSHLYRTPNDEESAKDRTTFAPPPYVPRPSPAPAPATLPPVAVHGGDSDVEYAVGETRPLREGKDTAIITKKKTTTTSTTAQPRRVRFLNWSPMNCSNPRDCCLNCLFCVVAPIVVLLIITIVLLTLILG